jgi:hypothetical protein
MNHTAAGLAEWRYWNIDRRTQRFLPWVARKLPKRIKYYVVIHGMVTVESDGNPSDVTGMQLLDLWKVKP